MPKISGTGESRQPCYGTVSDDEYLYSGYGRRRRQRRERLQNEDFRPRRRKGRLFVVLIVAAVVGYLFLFSGLASPGKLGKDLRTPFGRGPSRAPVTVRF